MAENRTDPDYGLPEDDPRSTPRNGKLGRLRVRHLQLLDHIDLTGSLTAAAAAIGVSQPAATIMLREVEEAFGRSLIERLHRGGRLNAAGAQVLVRLRVALSALDAATASLHADIALPLVRIGILPLVGIEAICSVVGKLEVAGDLPRIEVQTGTVGELLKMLSDGVVDCVVSMFDHDTAATDVQRFQLTRLWEERLVIVAAAGHPLVRRRSVELHELLDEAWIRAPEGSRNRHSLDRFFLSAGLTPPPARVVTRSFHIGLGLVSASRMLAAVPESTFRQYSGRVCQLRIGAQFPSNHVNLMTLRDVTPPPVVKTLEAAFKTYADELQGGARKNSSPVSQNKKTAADRSKH